MKQNQKTNKTKTKKENEPNSQVSMHAIEQLYQVT